MPEVSRFLIDVVEVKPLTEYRLYLRFEDGVAGEVDIARLVSFTGVFAPLQDSIVAEVSKPRFVRESAVRILRLQERHT